MKATGFFFSRVLTCKSSKITESMKEYHLAVIKPSMLFPSQILQCRSAKPSAEVDSDAKPESLPAAI